ncbi:MAG: phosphate ABC transporter permease PstA [Verrucomicrobia bacterium]|nr:MAG: phosphate ABC transporter permease PstA [Verrucomicrobiota bacterium]TAE89356.1 MAG: phosphate ABC transporter permease PstA [Verrucomicrobiota bacterium]TAF27768.1 MAG: phosphate ABC transporter permease PstA [Verrucomicrobiota bacterium]TAF42617.1 MAG: phosphate ABC transporter permease PstA [Verrucomicrobiota bacterium]
MENPEQLIRKGVHHDRLKEGTVKAVLGGLTWGVVLVALLIFGRICWDGAPAVLKSEFPFVDTDFLTAKTETLHVFDDAVGNRHSLPATEYHAWVEKEGSDAVFNEQTYSYSGGGIAGPIAGTALLTLLSIAMALFFGVAAAIYLSEYAKQGRFIGLVRLAILNLAGVPSIVFGLFGFAVFVLAAPVFTEAPSERSLLAIPLGFTWFSFQGWNSSLIAGAATLACMILPVIITASEESLKAVPQGFREASLAMGATRWQTIRKCVLPFALPGILTSSVLSLARAAGETAPIMFTVAVAAKDDLPWEGLSNPFGIFQTQVQALPYHIYTLAARIPSSEFTQRAQYGSVFVFLMMIFLFSALSIILRNRVRSKLKW